MRLRDSLEEVSRWVLGSDPPKEKFYEDRRSGDAGKAKYAMRCNGLRSWRRLLRSIS